MLNLRNSHKNSKKASTNKPNKPSSGVKLG